MYTMTMIQLTRQYKNDGQHAEQCARYTLTGQIEKADNIPFTVKADCLSYQIKAHRATICKGTDIKAHIKADRAERYIYVRRDFEVMYIMNPIEWLDFCETFGTVTTESKANGGATKTRLKTEGNAMREWLRART